MTAPHLLQPQTAVTSETGSYVFPRIAIGTYAVKFELTGFKTVVVEAVMRAIPGRETGVWSNVKVGGAPVAGPERIAADSATLEPKNELGPPMVFLFPAPTPKNELELPAVFEAPTAKPKNELLAPLVFEEPAPPPKNELKLPPAVLL